MSLTDLLKSDPRGQADKVMLAYDGLDEEQKEAFRLLMANPAFSAPQIARALKDMGYDVDGAQVAHTRRKIKSGKVNLESL